jgi:hypothetical protein
MLQVFVQILYSETLQELTPGGRVDLTYAAYQFLFAHTWLLSHGNIIILISDSSSGLSDFL